MTPDMMNQNDAQRFLGASQVRDGDGKQRDKVKDEYYRTLAYQRMNQIEIWMQDNRKNASIKEREKRDSELEETKKDCSLGERILFSQPMNVHIRYSGVQDSQLP